jgi:uncharacterized paraquat-inducible protein A
MSFLLGVILVVLLGGWLDSRLGWARPKRAG